MSEEQTKEQILEQAGLELEAAVAKYKKTYIEQTGEENEPAYFWINKDLGQSIFITGQDYSDIFTDFMTMNILD